MGKPTKCSDFVMPTQSQSENITERINSTAHARYWEYNYHGTQREFRISRLLCQMNYQENFHYGEVIYRIEVSDENGNIVSEECFNPVCYVTNFKFSKKQANGDYTIRFIDFPQAKLLTFTKE